MKNGGLMGFNGDSMVIQWWFNGDLMGYMMVYPLVMSK
jgi:asparagine N-glycosylation enzyme membrane subunit Stt3